MVSFCIKNNNNNIVNYLLENFSLINCDNIYISTKTFSKYNNIIIHYNGINISEFYDNVCNVLCNCVLTFYEPIILKKLIYLNYFYFDSVDISNIERNCKELLLLKNNLNSSEHFFSKKIDTVFDERKICLWTCILKYITSNKSMILDGFVTFRTKSYLEYLDLAIDTAVNQFVIDKEYIDFINLLKLYIKSKPPICDIVHLIYVNNESILLDKSKNIISTDNSHILNINYLSDISFSSNDYALDTLLSLLPNKIIIHLLEKEDEFINTLKFIFEDAIQICSNCSICQTYKALDKKKI